jgi:hypothetical protein
MHESRWRVAESQNVSMIITSIQVRHHSIEIGLHNSRAWQCQFPYLQANLNGKHGEILKLLGWRALPSNRPWVKDLISLLKLAFSAIIYWSNHRTHHSIPVEKSSGIPGLNMPDAGSLDGWQIAGIHF